MDVDEIVPLEAFFGTLFMLGGSAYEGHNLPNHLLQLILSPLGNRPITLTLEARDELIWLVDLAFKLQINSTSHYEANTVVVFFVNTEVTLSHQRIPSILPQYEN